MKFDKNSVIGFVLLAGLLLGYFYFTRVGQLELEEKQKQIRDSLAAILPVIKDTAAGVAFDADATKLAPQGTPGSFVQEGAIEEKKSVLENELVTITFSNKGARPIAVQLKKYVSADSQAVQLVSGDFNKFSYLINT